jgi:hypothetical protein
MNLVCPHCQKLVTVSDQNAGQMASCPSCNQTFLVPSLPQTAHLPPLEPELPVDISLTPEPPAPERPKLEPSGHAEDQEGAYKMASEPPKQKPKPLFSTYEREEISGPATRPAPVSAAGRATPSSSPSTGPDVPPPGDYTHHRSVTLNPRALPPFVMITGVLLFFLLFFPWTGVYPGGYRLYTQTGFQTWYGNYSTDQVGEEALGGAKPFDPGDVRANWLMFLYFLLLLAALVLVFSPLVVTHGSVKLPPALQQIWPWRLALLGAVLALTFLILLGQNWIGFGIENAVVAHVDGSLEKEREAAKTPEKQEIYNIHRGMAVGRYGLQRTAWYRLAVFLQILTLVGVGLEIWLERRDPRPLPRADFHW